MLGAEPLHLDLSCSIGCGTLTRVTTGHRVLSLPSITASYQDSTVLSDVDVALSLHLILYPSTRACAPPSESMVSSNASGLSPNFEFVIVSL